MPHDIADFFRVLTGDSTVTCAIRLAYEREDGEKEYRTVSRSSGMEAIRADRSVPIPANEGLPAKLRSARYQGVLIIDDVSKAIASKDYFKTPNDELPDCKSFIVSPINGWESGKKAMVGMLSIASRRTSAFAQWHTTSAKAIADLLGLVYPILLVRISSRRKAGGATYIQK